MLYNTQELSKGGIQNLIGRARALFDWHHNTADEFFERENVTRESDPERELLQAIGHHVKSTDIVLTTPQHADLFKEAGAKSVSIYDISPIQLEETVTSSEKYWCDIFHRKLLENLLDLCRPTVMFLSNIPEYAPSQSELSELVDVLNGSTCLNKVVLSRLSDNERYGVKFVTMLAKRGWNVETYNEPDYLKRKILVLSRQTRSIVE